jgi:DnaK suppressor protein
MSAPRDHLQAAELRELRDRLEAHRRWLLSEYRQDLERERAIPADEIGDVADRAESAEDREELFAAASEALDRVREVDAALRRISDGSYGICLSCGRPIPLPRLRAIPWAGRCAEDQQAIEDAERRGQAGTVVGRGA